MPQPRILTIPKSERRVRETRKIYKSTKMLKSGPAKLKQAIFTNDRDRASPYYNE